ncbi:hypothetical protein [Pedobacter gandavensis]|uniref:hypothetical protein n=1 Tax=Pedobacter gandavensis TaxID=2679963 RepID=UPI00292E3794|nr:hypothetical protein [Pedobacter gandavensis]
MKKISLVIISIIFGFTAMAQQIAVSSIVDINFQKGTKKLSSTEAQSLSKRNNEGDDMKKNGEFYAIDDFILWLVPGQVNVPQGYLEQVKKGMFNFYQLSPPKNYSAIIKTINNYQVLIFNYDIDSLSYYNFHCVYSDNKKLLNGSAVFNVSEKKEIIGKLDNLLKNIRFKP